MGAELIEAGTEIEDAPPASVWATNGGIYLGLTVQGRTDQQRPLAWKELERPAPLNAPIRSAWQPDGCFHRFSGEGHVATIGPQGSGKTRKLFMPNLLKLHDWSCVVIDTKGALCAYTAVERASRGHKVYVIDPFKVIETKYPRLFAQHPDLFKSRGFNPLADLNPDKPSFIDDAKALAMALIQSDDARDPYWPMAAQALAKGLAMVLRLDKPGKSDSLAVFRDYLGLKPQQFAEFIDADIKRLGKKWPAVAASLGEFATHSPDDKELGGIRRTAKAQTDWLDSPLIRADLSQKNVIDFESFKTTPQTCYLILPPEQLVTHGVWLRLMVTAALRPLLRSVERSPVPVLFMLDEIAQMGRMAMIENNIAQMREFGVKLWTVWQHVEQMKNTYKDGWANFMATAQAKITFTADDSETREYFSKLGGERLFTHQTQSEAVTKSQGGNWGRSDGSGTSRNDGSTWGSNSGHSRPLGSSESHYNGGNSSGGSLSSGDSINQGQSCGGNWSVSHNTSTGEQRINERCVRPHELAALDADEALIFARRGEMHRAICPQPDSASAPCHNGRDQSARLAVAVRVPALAPLLQVVARLLRPVLAAGRFFSGLGQALG